MIEIGNHPDALGAVMLHSTESGQFFSCDRVEFERLAAGILRGDLDDFLNMRVTSVRVDGDPDWTTAGVKS
jgi:hypothetical protein